MTNVVTPPTSQIETQADSQTSALIDVSDIESAGTSTPKRSLNDVRAIIPASCYERSSRRAAWALVQAWTLYLIPMLALILVQRWWVTLIAWPLAGLGVAGLFVLGHDASHAALVESRRANRLIARLCMAPSIHVESAWDLGHNRIHHGYTTREGFDFVWHPLTVEDYQKLSALGRLRHRLEWSAFGAGAYYMRTVWWQKMWRFNPDGKRRETVVHDKIELGSIVVVGTVAAATYGYFVDGGILGAIWMPIKLIVVPFLIFVQVIAWTVYVHHVGPDIKWWKRKEWTQFHGQMESTTILTFPRVVNKLWFYNIFVHVPHHVDARIPFHQLPAAADAIIAAYPDTVRVEKWSLSDYMGAAHNCKLYDFDAGTWLPYSAARTSAKPATASAA